MEMLFMLPDQSLELCFLLLNHRTGPQIIRFEETDSFASHHFNQFLIYFSLMPDFFVNFIQGLQLSWVIISGNKLLALKIFDLPKLFS